METVIYEIRDKVAFVTINRPHAYNACDKPTYERLAEVWQDFAVNDDAWVAILTGAGDKAFCAGNDLKWQAAGGKRGWDKGGFAGLTPRFDCDKPIIAAVNGPAVGIGTTMLLHCDLVYVSRDATLKMPFVNLGLCPEYGSSLILPRLLGHARAAELLLLGQSFTGEQAATWGIANQALDSGAATLAKAREMALRFQLLAPAAVADSKRLMRAPGREELRRVIEEEGALFGQRLRSPEAIEALTAFMQRRPPNFGKFA